MASAALDATGAAFLARAAAPTAVVRPAPGVPEGPEHRHDGEGQVHVAPGGVISVHIVGLVSKSSEQTPINSNKGHQQWNISIVNKLFELINFLSQEHHDEETQEERQDAHKRNASILDLSLHPYHTEDEACNQRNLEHSVPLDELQYHKVQGLRSDQGSNGVEAADYFGLVLGEPEEGEELGQLDE